MITVSVSTIRTGVLQRAAGGNTMKNLGLLVIALATATTVHGQERAIYRDPAVPVEQRVEDLLARGCRVEATVAIEQLFFLRPDRGDLRDLLFLRHARRQVLDALFDRDRGIAIDRTLLAMNGSCRSQCDHQQAQVLHRISPCRALQHAGSY